MTRVGSGDDQDSVRLYAKPARGLEERVQVLSQRLCVALAAEHLLDLRDVHFLVADFLACVLLERDVATFVQLEKPAVKIDARSTSSEAASIFSSD